MGKDKAVKIKPVKAVAADRPTRRPKRPGTVKHRSGLGKAIDARWPNLANTRHVVASGPWPRAAAAAGDE